MVKYKYYANCSTDMKIQIVGPFPDILEVTEYGYKWSVKHNHEPRWHVVTLRDELDIIIEKLNPHKAFTLLGFDGYGDSGEGA